MKRSSKPASRLVRIPAPAWALCRSLQRPRETTGDVIEKALKTLARCRNRPKARKEKTLGEETNRLGRDG